MKHKDSYLVYLISSIVFSAVTLWGMFLPAGMEAVYSLICYHIAMPLVSFAGALALGLRRSFLWWFFPVLFGFWGILMPYMVFNATNYISLTYALAPAGLGMLLGLGLGCIPWLRRFRSR